MKSLSGASRACVLRPEGVCYVSSRVRSVRATPEEWARWADAAGKRSLNGWVREILGAAADAALAERRRVADVLVERERVRAAMRGEL